MNVLNNLKYIIYKHIIKYKKSNLESCLIKIRVRNRIGFDLCWIYHYYNEFNESPYIKVNRAILRQKEFQRL